MYNVRYSDILPKAENALKYKLYTTTFSLYIVEYYDPGLGATL